MSLSQIRRFLLYVPQEMEKRFKLVLWEWGVQILGRFPDQSYLEQKIQTLRQERWKQAEGLHDSPVQGLSQLPWDNWASIGLQAHGLQQLYREILLGVPKCEQEWKLVVWKLQWVLWEGGPDPENQQLLNDQSSLS